MTDHLRTLSLPARRVAFVLSCFLMSQAHLTIKSAVLGMDLDASALWNAGWLGGAVQMTAIVLWGLWLGVLRDDRLQPGDLAMLRRTRKVVMALGRERRRDGYWYEVAFPNESAPHEYYHARDLAKVKE